MNSLEINTNSTTRFLVPIVFKNAKYDELIANGFIKAYVGMLDDPDYDDSLIMVFNEDTNETLLEDLFDDMDVDVKHDPENDDLRLYVINDWQDYIEETEYSTFLSGAWSKLEQESKDNILTFWGEDETSIVGMVLSRNPKFETIIKDFTSTIFAGGYTHEPDDNTEYWPKPNIVEDELYYTGDHK